MGKSRNLLAQGLANLDSMGKQAETVRQSEQEKTEQASERRTANKEVEKPLNKKIDRTANGDIKAISGTRTTQETPTALESSEVYITERERVKANLEKNPTGLKRPQYTLKGRAKQARTYREAFQMTADLGTKLDEYIKATNGNKSEFIRRAIARELSKVEDDM